MLQLSLLEMFGFITPHFSLTVAPTGFVGEKFIYSMYDALGTKDGK